MRAPCDFDIFTTEHTELTEEERFEIARKKIDIALALFYINRYLFV